MAKREFIDKNDIIYRCSYNGDCYSEKCDKCSNYVISEEDIEDIKPITEQDIVKPYLELLLKEMHSLEEINHDDNRYDKGYQHGRASCEAMVMHMIDTLLSEQGDTE